MTRAAARVPVLATLAAALTLLAALMLAPSASATVEAPGWAIRSLAQPTNFSAAGDGACEASPESQVCDSYTLLVTNVGSVASSGEVVTISDTLPAGLKAVGIEGEDLATGSQLACVELQCVDDAVVPVGDTLRVRIDVVVEAGLKGVIESSASVAGGGAPPAATSDPTTIVSEPAPFGIAAFDVQALDAAGAPETQAGGHPYSLTTSFYFTTGNQAVGGGASYHAAEDVKDVVLDLPPGLVIDPRAAPQCPLYALQAAGGSGCPDGAVGSIVLEGAGERFASPKGRGVKRPPSTT